MKINPKFDLPDYLRDAEEVVFAFSPNLLICPEGEPFEVSAVFTEHGLKFKICHLVETLNNHDKRLLKFYFKRKLYEFCAKLTHKKLPYGSLTGVRPTRLYYEGKGSRNARIGTLVHSFFVSEEKANLIADVCENQAGIYMFDPTAVDIFVNIPFCPTRCAYCSFISTEIARVKNKIPAYVDKICEELSLIQNKIIDGNRTVRAIYVGGGTPTSLPPSDIKRILSFLSNYGVEFTVEAGRADTITKEHLDVFAASNVTRISINPESASDATLKAIGRTHTFSDVKDAFALARKYKFLINSDIIAGLPTENLDTFKDTVKSVIDLGAENITVHSLSLKRGSKLTEAGDTKIADGSVAVMTAEADKLLRASGYIPYYMYRQKSIADNLENVGYCLPNTQCIYNVDIMEETNDVLGAGAGAVTKTINRKTNLITRMSGAKDINLYLERPSVHLISGSLT